MDISLSGHEPERSQQQDGSAFRWTASQLGKAHRNERSLTYPSTGEEMPIHSKIASCSNNAFGRLSAYVPHCQSWRSAFGFKTLGPNWVASLVRAS